MNPAFVPLVLAATVAASAASPPPAPDFDRNVATPSVLVATSEPGEYYAEPEECLPKNVICLRYPLWFLAKPVLPVFGTPPHGVVRVTTYTHYGQPEPDDASAPRVMLLLAQNDNYLMPVYASERVWRRSDGEYYLLLDSKNPPYWLPCSVAELRESIDARRFPTGIRLALDDYLVTEYPQMFAGGWRYVVPKFGISITRLGDHLRNLQATEHDFKCMPEEAGEED